MAIFIQKSDETWCLDGSNCMHSNTCNICEGGACLRVQRFTPNKGVSIAMTCIPHDSLVHAYHPEGCRTDLSTGEKLCLCSGRDFCNSSLLSFNFPQIFLYIAIFCVFFIF
ncbi:unnamed protein product [Caenorhabditis angaria]|uniref:Uncharacterized protein n=1 Tax=Caenorhabditis angaria TaxID=860376 RepID=A0A9P1IUT3_9PELO|nr:unnamed protein product [Caenorhabditis angaria]